MFKKANFLIFNLLYILVLNTHNINKNENSEEFNSRNLNIVNNTIKNKKNLVIAAIINYSWSKIKLFFISLFKAGFKNCDYVLYVRGISNETIKKIESCGFITYQIPNHIFKLRTTINNFRWKLYKDFLLENKDKYNMVFTADVRDTIFQRDVFQFYDSSKSFLGIFLEDGDMRTLANKVWVLRFLNESEYHMIENETVVCTGTLIGTVDKFLEFSQELWHTVKPKKRVVDQGGANYLIYYKKYFNDCIIKGDNHGFVMTIGLTHRKNVFLDNDNNILNFDGKVAAVVHQYDRKKRYIERLKTKYNDSFIFDVNSGKNIINSKKKIKYYFTLVVFIFIIMTYLFYLYIKKKRNKNLKKFKRIKLKVFKQKEIAKKIFHKNVNDYNIIPQNY